MEDISAQLSLILDKISSFDTRLSGVEDKLQRKTKPKSKGTRDISQVHIFPFDVADDYVKMALIDDSQKKNEAYPVVEFLKLDFEKLGNLILHSEVLSLQWSDFNTSNQVAKYENN